MKPIIVPKTPKKAFNPDRIASGLIQAQIQHLEAAAGIYPKKNARRAKPRTERQSADYIERLTAEIYERAGAPPGPEVAVPQPPPPIAGTATPTSTTRVRAGGSVTARKSRPARSSRSATTRRSASTAAGRPASAGQRRTAAKKKRTAKGRRSRR